MFVFQLIELRASTKRMVTLQPYAWLTLNHTHG